MANQRILQGRAATLTVNLTDYNGVTADAVGTITVGIVGLDGTEVLAAGSATTHPGPTGVYQRALTAAQTADLNQLTVTWTDSGGGDTVTTVDIVGGYYFSVQEARQSDATLGGQAAYTDADVIRVRQEVEEECERITGRAFVPRFARAILSGRGTSYVFLPTGDLRSVRQVLNDGTALTGPEIAGLVLTEHGAIMHDSGVFTLGFGSVVIDYEYGWDSPPADLKRAALTRLRHRLNMAKSGIPDRARFREEEGLRYGIIPIGPDTTGIDEVDAVYQAYSLRAPVVA